MWGGKKIMIQGTQKVGNSPSWPEAFHWWIDAVGGYLCVTSPVVRIGQAGEPKNQIAVLADIASHHADIRRGPSGTVLIAHADARVNGQPGSEFLLRDNDRIQLKGLELEYRQPLSWSSTARLRIASRHRLPLALDGVLLLGETCVVGPGPEAHLQAPWLESVLIHWNQERYWCRSKGPLVIDGVEHDGNGPLSPNSAVEAAGGSFHWEPIRGK